jgi:alanyl-tRNA synthetase
VTERLYLHDGYARTFDARVVSVRTTPEGVEVVLDRTLFYPTSGGQRHDTGTLGAGRVRDVRDQGDDVVHVLDVAPGGDRVAGAVDWDARFDHMQQHTGQHLLSAVIEEHTGAATVSFHMGPETSSIDLAAPVFGEDVRTRVEDLVNARVQENRPVHVQFPTDAELAALPLRKDPAVTTNVRVISIDGIDHSPCGGTHLRATGEIGAIHLLGTERVRDATRLGFVCGRRALLRARRDRGIVSALAARFTTREDGVRDAVERLDADARAARRSEQTLSLELAQADAHAALARGDGPVVIVGDGWSAERAGEFARVVARDGGRRACVIVPSADAARGHVVLVTGADGAGDALRAIVAASGGKGGGTAEFARGATAPGASLEATRDVAERLLRG